MSLAERLAAEFARLARRASALVATMHEAAGGGLPAPGFFIAAAQPGCCPEAPDTAMTAACAAAQRAARSPQD